MKKNFDFGSPVAGGAAVADNRANPFANAPPAPQARTPAAAKPVSATFTDPDTIREAVRSILGEDVATLLREQVAAQIKELGLTTADRRYLATPEALIADAESQDEIEARLWDRRKWSDKTQPEHVATRRMMDAWFRAVLFGRSVKDEGLRAAFTATHERMAMEYRDLSEGTDADGGYLVPPGFIAEVILDAEKISQLFQYVRKIPVGVNSGEIPKESTDVTVSWGSENTEITHTGPAFGSATWTVYRLNAICKMSREVVNDSNPGIVDVVTELFRRKIFEERDRAVANGSGSGQPMGIYSATGLTEYSFAELNYDTLVGLMSQVDHRYYNRPSTRWTMRQSVFHQIMRLKDNEGRPLVHIDPLAGFKPMLLGHGISIEQGFPANYIGFGDLSYYLWFDREVLGVERSTQAGDSFAKHQVWIKFWERAGGLPVLPAVIPMARNRILAV